MHDSIRTVSLRPSLARKFVDSNPFYLLSALCMLAGLFALKSSLDWSLSPQHNLLTLLVVLNLYEGLLIVFGMILSAKGVKHDAATLFIMEALFLVDAGFVNFSLFISDFNLGLFVSIGLFFLSMLKLAAVFHGLGISLTDGRYPLMLAQMLILLAMGGLFKQASAHNNADLHPGILFAAWWVVGLIPVLYLLFLRHDDDTPVNGIVGVYIGFAFVSILAHLCTTNWVYHVRWTSANLSPMLLGLATAIGASDRHVRNLTARMWMHLSLPMLAILLALETPPALDFDMSGFPMTPLRLILFGAFAVYAHGLLIHKHPYFAVAGVSCLTAGTLGESPGAMDSNVMTWFSKLAVRMSKLVPESGLGWGILSIIASFVLLALGMVVSLFKPSEKREEDQIAFAAVYEEPDP